MMAVLIAFLFTAAYVGLLIALLWQIARMGHEHERRPNPEPGRAEPDEVSDARG